MKPVVFAICVAVGAGGLGLHLGSDRLRDEEPMRQLAGSQAVSTMTIDDIALQTGGILTGWVLDERLSGLAGIVVVIRRGDREAARALTDESGVFLANNLRGGVYQIIAAGAKGFFRCWAPNTAPPSAGHRANLASGGPVIPGPPGLLHLLPTDGPPVAVVALSDRTGAREDHAVRMPVTP